MLQIQKIAFNTVALYVYIIFSAPLTGDTFDMYDVRYYKGALTKWYVFSQNNFNCFF